MFMSLKVEMPKHKEMTTKSVKVFTKRYVNIVALLYEMIKVEFRVPADRTMFYEARGPSSSQYMNLSEDFEFVVRKLVITRNEQI